LHRLEEPSEIANVRGLASLQLVSGYPNTSGLSAGVRASSAAALEVGGRRA
jgi:hypothetical protein